MLRIMTCVGRNKPTLVGISGEATALLHDALAGNALERAYGLRCITSVIKKCAVQLGRNVMGDEIKALTQSGHQRHFHVKVILSMTA